MNIRFGFMCALLFGGIAGAQSTSASSPSAPATDVVKSTITIPTGTRIPLSLKQAISTKTAKTGDPVYAEVAFPFAIDEKIVVPAGTYIQGKIERAQRGLAGAVLDHPRRLSPPNGIMRNDEGLV